MGNFLGRLLATFCKFIYHLGIDRRRESPKTEHCARFRRNLTIEKASQRRIIALGTSNKAKLRTNRSKNDDFRKGAPDARNPVTITRMTSKKAPTSGQRVVLRNEGRVRGQRRDDVKDQDGAYANSGIDF